jgi:AraC family transcriptional regulator
MPNAECKMRNEEAVSTVVRCGECAAEFSCGAGCGKCWCMDLPHVSKMPVEEAGCLCRECLVMSQSIIELPGATVAYLRQVGPYGPAIQQLWAKLRDWALPRGLWTDAMVCYGISHDSPMDTPPEKCRYDACIVVPKDMVIDGGASSGELPGGPYARLAFSGKAMGISAAFGRVFHEVIPAAKKEFDFSRPCFELYTGITKMGPDGSFECDICVPVK